jgi:hypothetical protein
MPHGTEHTQTLSMRSRTAVRLEPGNGGLGSSQSSPFAGDRLERRLKKFEGIFASKSRVLTRQKQSLEWITSTSNPVSPFVELRVTQMRDLLLRRPSAFRSMRIMNKGALYHVYLTTAFLYLKLKEQVHGFSVRSSRHEKKQPRS